MRFWQVLVSAFLTASMLYFHGSDYLAMLKAARDFSLPPIEQPVERLHPHNGKVVREDPNLGLNVPKWGN